MAVGVGPREVGHVVFWRRRTKHHGHRRSEKLDLRYSFEKLDLDLDLDLYWCFTFMSSWLNKVVCTSAQ